MTARDVIAEMRDVLQRAANALCTKEHVLLAVEVNGLKYRLESTLVQPSGEAVDGDVPAMAQSWLAVCKLLDEIAPEWSNTELVGRDAAIKAIRALYTTPPAPLGGLTEETVWSEGALLGANGKWSAHLTLQEGFKIIGTMYGDTRAQADNAALDVVAYLNGHASPARRLTAPSNAGLTEEEREAANNNLDYIDTMDGWAIGRGLLPDPLPYEGGGEACARNIIAGIEAEFRRLTAPRAEGVDRADDPEADATDYAHPAWWRGHDHTFAVMCQEVNEILDGKPLFGVASEPWESLRKRLAALTAAAPKVESPRTYEDAIRIATDPNRKPAAAPQAEGEDKGARHPHTGEWSGAGFRWEPRLDDGGSIWFERAALAPQRSERGE